MGRWARIGSLLFQLGRMSPNAPSQPDETDASNRAEGFQRVVNALHRLGHDQTPRWLEVAARTSQEAADALGVALGQIAKSVVFRRREDDQAVLVIASGDRRVDEQRLAALVGPVRRADAQYVKSCTGFAIGGVSPVGLCGEPVLLLDRELQRFAEIWAAAGHPNGVFQLAPQDLQRLTGAPWVDVVSG
jgi:prolyl-tRNA editing enzyme YbaK/EbsC (Cys-tRNA(Pro) deacylase)